MQHKYDHEQSSPSPTQKPTKKSPFDEIHWVGIGIVSLGIGLLIFFMWLIYLYSTAMQICHSPGSCM